MSDVVLENTRDIKCIFQTSRFIKFTLFWEFIYFFALLNNQIIATEKILQFVLKSFGGAGDKVLFIFLELRSTGNYLWGARETAHILEI